MPIEYQAASFIFDLIGEKSSCNLRLSSNEPKLLIPILQVYKFFAKLLHEQPGMGVKATTWRC